MNLIEIKNLKTYFHTENALVKAVDDVSLSIPRGKTLGIVGESGCGKSVTAMSILQLVSPPGKIDGGEILLYDQQGQSVDLVKMSEPEIRKVRGKRIAMIFQEPMSSLNPVFTIGYQIVEAVQLHRPELTKKEAWDLAVEMLDKVRIPAPEQRAREYPHQ